MRLNLPSLGATVLSTLLALAPTSGSAQNLSSAAAAAAGIHLTKAQLNVGQQYYISGHNLNVRSSNSTTAQNVVGKLALNDVVELYDLLNEATPLVQIKIIKSSQVPTEIAPELYVSKDYLSEKPVDISAASRYFVIQNIATEKTRVYERCTTSPDCPHKLVFESETVVGRPEEGTKHDPKAYITWLGHSRIADWVKFYSDGAGTYPSWYTAGQDIDSIPTPISTSATKFLGAKKWTMRYKGKSTMYGAFGWYAARLSPADESGVNYQWMHGTIGWGQDEDKAIEITRGFFVNLFSNPGSHGCTRLENRSIAFMRHLLPVGTDIYRVYARESVREPGRILSRYVDQYRRPGHWEYILLTNGAQKTNGLTADAKTIRDAGINVLRGVNFLEQGVFNYDHYPNAMARDYSKTASSGKSGDRYKVDSGRAKDATNFRGYYLVDEGRFVDYQHPNERAVEGKVKVSGLPDFRRSVPEFLQAQGTHYPPPTNFR